jgi:hypothetical protein
MTLVYELHGFYQSGTHAATRIVGVVVVQVAIRIDVPHVVGVAGIRGNSPIPEC